LGFWIGDNGELSDTPRTISLMAATECRMLHLPRDSIRKLLTNEPKYWQSFYRLGQCPGTWCRRPRAEPPA
jgi:CRP-like cAMP-binding protein